VVRRKVILEIINELRKLWINLVWVTFGGEDFCGTGFSFAAVEVYLFRSTFEERGPKAGIIRLITVMLDLSTLRRR
jgi:hypothetical protein